MKKVFTCLFVAAAFMLLAIGAKAQGGLAPFAGSTHEYSVTPESGSNTLLWSVLEGADGTEYDINSGAATATLNITWNTAGTYTLQFSETDPTTLCATVKQVTVEVGANTFDVSVSDPLAICNAADGVVNYVGTDATTSVSFTVDMTTANVGFSPDWEIDFTLTPGTGTPSISNVTASSGTLSGTGPYNLTGLTSTSGDGMVTISMDVEGDIYTLLDAVLNITSAVELSYDTADIDNDDWSATQTVNAIPGTTSISTD